jgi:hypothetical protein
MRTMTRNISGSAFALQFDHDKLPALIEGYKYKSSEDNAALKAGAEIRASICSRANFEVIFTWKTNGRGKSRPQKNSDGEIAAALSLAVAAKTERAAISVLCGLQGVDVPVASAIMTAIDPERYTVIDFRALARSARKQQQRSLREFLSRLSRRMPPARRGEPGQLTRSRPRALAMVARTDKAEVRCPARVSLVVSIDNAHGRRLLRLE